MVLQTQALIIVAAYLIGMLLVGFIVGKLKKIGRASCRERVSSPV